MAARSIKFGQRQRLTNRLCELVRKYPKGVGLFKEFLQNADDAGASALTAVLDLREHPRDVLPNSQMRCLQGRSLVFANDQVFSDEDWENIQDIGNSGKAMDIAKTGRFGLGFNCVYNVTDFPMLLTGNRLGIFDPHANTVEGASPEYPGAAWSLEALWKHHPDLLVPFVDFGLKSGQTEFNGTMFRLPLRDKGMAETSDICSEPYAADDFRQMVAIVETHASDLVLFLNSVCEFKLAKISRNGKRTDIVSIETKNREEISKVQSEIRDQISKTPTEVLSLAELFGDQTWFSEHELEITTRSETRVENWRRVRGLYGQDELLTTAREMCDFEEKAIPLAGAAIQLTPKNGNGILSCSLPLPTNSGTPLHIDGYFDLHDSRQDIFQDTTASGQKSKTRVKWNRLLLQHACAKAAAELLTKVANETGDPNYDHWPKLADSGSDTRLIENLPSQIYEALLPNACIPAGHNGVFAKPDKVKLSPESIQEPLLSAGVAIPNPQLPPHVVRGFKETGSAINKMVPADVRELLRDYDFQDIAFSEATISCLREEEWLLALLKFCLADREYDEFDGVPLALMSDGKLRKFDADDPTRLYLGNDAEKSLLSEVPNLFLADKVAGIGVERLPNVMSLGLDSLIDQLTGMFTSVEEDEYVDYDDSVDGLPTYEWLTEFYNHCADVVRDERRQYFPGQNLSKLPMVPDMSGRLWGMCSASTPIFIPVRQQPQWLLELLSVADISVVSSAGELGRAISRFKSVIGDSEIVTLTPIVLVELVSSNVEAMVDFMNSRSGMVSKFLSYVTTGKLSDSTLRDLSELEIFPLIGGGTTAIRGDVYQSTGFQPPEISTSVELLESDNGRLTELYEQFGVKKMTQPRFVLDFVLEGFDDISSDDQRTALVWLMENYYSLMKDINEPTRSKFAKKIRTTKLIRCDDGELHSASEVYHPECKDVLKLLGAAGHCPDLSVYPTDDWLDFFITLGMERHARPVDLIRAIDCLMDETLNSRVANKIKQLATFIEAHWEEFHDETVEDQIFSEALSERRWLPAISVCPSRVPESLFLIPVSRLFSPNELARREDLELVSSVRPVCRFTIAQPMAGSIGHVSPTIGDVLDQFDILIDKCHGVENVSESEAGIFKRIYGFVGFAVSDQTGSVTAIALSAKYSSVSCLIDRDNKIWKPEETFRAPVPYFLHLRQQVKFQGDVNEKCVTALGRKHAPDVEDFRLFFESYNDLCENGLVVKNDRKQIRDAYIYAAATADANGLSSTPVLSSDARLRPANSVLINDAPWLSERATEAGINFLDNQLGQNVATTFGVGQLSQVIVERIESVDENADEKLVGRCEQLNQTIQSPSFAKGLLRLLPSDTQVQDSFDLLTEFDVVPASIIQTVLNWDGEDVAGSQGETEYVFENNRLFVTKMSDAVLRLHIAEAITRRVFGKMDFSNESYVHMMLAEHPEDINSVLTQLRVPDLPPGRTVAAIDDVDDFVDVLSPQDKSNDSETDGSQDETFDDASSTSDANVKSTSGVEKGNPRALERSKIAGRSGVSSGRTEKDPPKVRTGINRRSSNPKPRRRRAVTYARGSEPDQCQNTPEEKTHRNDVDVEAIKRVKRHEQKDRVPTVMPHFNKGYDIESRISEEGDVERFIEVKGLGGAWGEFGVKLTPAQVQFGTEKGDKHWLYVVEFATDAKRARVHMIQNPVKKITDYFFDAGWKQLCTEMSEATKRKPVEKCRVTVANEGDGTVVKIVERGRIMRLTIELDDGNEIKHNYPNPSITVIE